MFFGSVNGMNAVILPCFTKECTGAAFGNGSRGLIDCTWSMTYGTIWTMISDHGTFDSMEEIRISKFKATCLAVLDRVGKTRSPVLVTRFGKPVAQVVPPPSPAGDWLGAMKDDGEVRGDLIAPVADLSDWEALD